MKQGLNSMRKSEKLSFLKDSNSGPFKLLMHAIPLEPQLKSRLAFDFQDEVELNRSNPMIVVAPPTPPSPNMRSDQKQRIKSLPPAPVRHQTR